MRLSLLLVILFLTACLSEAQSQSNLVSVSDFTGTANVVIPLYTFKRGGLTMPVTAVYTANGIKVKDVEGNAGLGWQLFVGGAISRQLRGLPDDMKTVSSTEPSKIGWMYNSSSGNISGFNPANDGNFSTGSCSDESSDLSSINTFMGNLYDNEPDIFNVDAPGLNCRLIFDTTQQFKVISGDDVQITYSIDNNGGILSFTLTNNKGVKYIFDKIQRNSRQAVSSNPSAILFGKTDYDYFKTITVYANAWMLSSMIDRGNNDIQLQYTPGPYVKSSNPVGYYIGTNTTKAIQYKINDSSAPQILQYVLYTEDSDILSTKATFSFVTNPSTQISQIDNINVDGINIVFSYGDFASQKADGTYYYRKFLNGIYSGSSLNASNSPLNLHFDYIGNGTGYGGVPTTALPDSASKNIDYWGYYRGAATASLLPGTYVNPSGSSYERYRQQAPGAASSSYPYYLSASNRDPDPATVATATLNKITYDGGGTTTLEYESNDFADVTAGGVMQGGGIRVKTVTDYDGLNTAGNIVRNYSYLNPSTGLSSGKPVSLPIFAFTAPATAGATTYDMWANATIRSDEDLSEEDKTIIYGFTKVSQTGMGSTRYEYTTPATFWDAPVSDWEPAINYIGRTTCTAYNFLANSKYSYPFAPNVDYSFERGLPLHITHYNDAGQKISQTDYTYIRSYTPTALYALKTDINNGALARAYSKYKILAGTSKLVSQETKTVYDLGSTTSAVSTTVSYSYNGTLHKLPTSIVTTNSDGSQLKVNNKYVKDYDYSSVNSSSDNNAKALLALNLANANLNVESYTQVVRSGAALTTGGQLSTYDKYTNPYVTDIYLPAQRYSFVNAAGLSGFVPSAISAGTFSKSAAYSTPVENFVAYNNTGYLLTRDDNNHHIRSKIYENGDYNVVADILNARFNEVSYTDFNSLSYAYGFTNQTISGGGTYTTDSRTGAYGFAMIPADLLTRSLKKNPDAKNNVFSIWIKSASAGALTITFINSVSGAIAKTMAFGNTGGVYKYYEFKFPMTQITPDFLATFKTSTAIQIDDILVYPDVAEVTTFDYSPVNSTKLAETNTNGVSRFYKYDQWGRVNYILDQDKNIIFRKKYVTATSQSTSIFFYYDPSADIHPSTSISFYASRLPYYNNDNVNYAWNFGDGTAVVNTSSIAPVNHSYASTGNYTATLVISSPYYTPITLTRTVAVQ